MSTEQGMDDGRGRMEGGRRLSGRRAPKRKIDPFLADKSLNMDWRDANLLSRFVTERGKLMPRRVTGLCAKNQRAIKKAVKRARHLGILPYGGHRAPIR